MTDADGVLAARFAATYDALDTRDWPDVLRRAAPTDQRRKRMLLVAVTMAVIIVPTAIAFRGAIHDLFFGTPAPPVITRTFAGQNEMRAMATTKVLRLTLWQISWTRNRRSMCGNGGNEASEDEKTIRR